MGARLMLTEGVLVALLITSWMIENIFLDPPTEAAT